MCKVYIHHQPLKAKTSKKKKKITKHRHWMCNAEVEVDDTINALRPIWLSGKKDLSTENVMNDSGGDGGGGRQMAEFVNRTRLLVGIVRRH